MSNSGSYRVSDYMRESVLTLQPTATLREAVVSMVDGKTNGLVVIDTENHVAGILSSWDIIQYIVPDYLEADRHLAAFEAGSVFEERVAQLANEPISKFMTDKVHTIQATASIMSAAIILSEFRIRQLPVVDEHEKLVGYLNRTDIKAAVFDALRKTGNA